MCNTTMTTGSGDRIFLSYGRADAKDLAERLHQELTQLGYVPWQDTREIIGGPAWADQIVQGLKTTKLFVALLSPHSVRTRAGGADVDSVCLQEVAFACYQTHTPILPVMVVAPPCEVPLDIFRLQFLDFSRWKQSPAEFDLAFQKLREGLEAMLRGEKVPYRNWVDQLQPWDFGEFLDRKREHFTGRDWLFEEIRQWLHQGGEPSLLVTGDPGIGKSAIVAELVHRNLEGAVLAYHCCQSRVPETLNPGRCVRSLAAMIASRCPDYATALDRPELRQILSESACDKDPLSAFDRGVLNPLAHLPAPPDGLRLLVIDALDEAILPRQNAGSGPAPLTIVDLLRGAVEKLPPWLRLLATTRKEPEVLLSLQALKARQVEAQDPRNLSDLEAYALQRLAETSFAPKLAAGGATAAKIATDLVSRAQGNFLYVQKALDAVASGLVTLDELPLLPPGLHDQFQWFFERQFPSDARWQPVRRLFEVLVAAQDQLTVADLATALRLSAPAATAQLLLAATSFLRPSLEQPPRYALFHKALADWLTDPARQGAKYSAAPATGHQALAEGFWGLFETDVAELSPYALSHLATHLAHNARELDPAARKSAAERLVRFAVDPAVQFRRSADALGLHHSLLTALDAALHRPPALAVPLTSTASLALLAFRRERLNSTRLFKLASDGEVDAFEKELELFPAEQWRTAAQLVGAWLALPKNRPAAEALRQRARSGALLNERVDAAFEGRPPVLPPPPGGGNEMEALQVLSEIGGFGLGGEARGLAPVEATVPAPPGGSSEGRVYLADFHAPRLVAYALVAPEAGTQRLRDYIAVHSANAYRVYRNESLWRIAIAVLTHPDDAWARGMMQTLCEAALSGQGREFTSAAPLTLQRLRAARNPTEKSAADQTIQRIAVEADQLKQERHASDSWGDHRRRLCSLAEALAVIDGNRAQADGLLRLALSLPFGFAGFQTPACLGIAESLWICGGQAAQIGAALASAARAADNVQDPTFCARTVSRCLAVTRNWWGNVAAFQDAVSFAELLRRFLANPQAAEFAALHVVGWGYPGRTPGGGSHPVPDWVKSAASLEELARIYQWPLADFQRLNPEITDTGKKLAENLPVRVPDPRFAPWLATRFCAEALVVPNLPPDERTRLILQLVPMACASQTSLDKTLARLLLAAKPSQPAVLDELAENLRRHLPPENHGDAGLVQRLGPA